MAKIKIYSTTVCPWCVKAEEWFKEQDIEYEKINVQENHEAAREMIEKSGQSGVPVIEIDGKMVIGFNLPEIKTTLGMQ